jgi:Ni/Co efflux regulator RcnB
MRKLIISILLASVAASPALAEPHGRWRDSNDQNAPAQAHEQRQEQREQAREQRVERAEPARVQQQAVPQAQPQFEARRQQWQGGNFAGRRETVVQQQPQQPQQQQWQGRGGWDRNNAQAQVQAQQEQQRQFDRARRDGQAGQWQGRRTQDQQTQQWQGQRYQGQNYQGQNYQGQTYQGQRWSQSGQRWNQGSRTASNWNRDWRNDRRYDWRRYRDSHRSIFHIGVYYDPFNYGYQRFDIGYQLSPAYFGQQYWIDPAMYQLPYPPPGTTWVRYWNDAVLVDMYSGQVVDVIRDFFW